MSRAVSPRSLSRLARRDGSIVRAVHRSGEVRVRADASSAASGDDDDDSQHGDHLRRCIFPRAPTVMSAGGCGTQLSSLQMQLCLLCVPSFRDVS
ncbi:hypothetical protein MTO96_034331 [Rhipicephalus appendiculatus]